MPEPIRVLIAKAGLDGHDRGALVVAQGLRDEGMEVIYTGLRQTPEQIVAVAIQEDVACIGLSSLSGAHLELFPEVVRILAEQNAEDILVIGGGVIPEADIPELKKAGIAEVFTPGSTIIGMANFIRNHILQHRHEQSSAFSPMVTGLDHLGIAVKKISEALPFYQQVLGLNIVNEEEIVDQGVKAVFLELGEMHLELLEPTSDDSPIAKFIAKQGPGIHHVAYAVPDASEALARAKSLGYRAIDEAPRPGGQGKWIAFLHPKDTNGALTEFCQQSEKEEDVL